MKMSYGFSVVHVLPDLWGKPWNDVTRAYLRSLRPSSVRVVSHDDCYTSDAKPWRVTVFLTADGRISRLDQEVEVDLPDGVDHGHELRCRLEAV